MDLDAADLRLTRHRSDTSSGGLIAAGSGVYQPRNAALAEAAPPAAGRPEPGAAPPGGNRLTWREWEIAVLLDRRLTNRQIADELTISVRTVERHVENLYAKLGASGKAARAVVAVALREGLA